MKRPTILGADGMPVGWCAFAFLWFFASLRMAIIVEQTPLGPGPKSADFLFIWLIFAFGVIISAAVGATTWALILMDPRSAYPPRSPTRRSSRRAAKPARG